MEWVLEGSKVFSNHSPVIPRVTTITGGKNSCSCLLWYRVLDVESLQLVCSCLAHLCDTCLQHPQSWINGFWVVSAGALQLFHIL